MLKGASNLAAAPAIDHMFHQALIVGPKVRRNCYAARHHQLLAAHVFVDGIGAVIPTRLTRTLAPGILETFGCKLTPFL
jgi:hypothetical protein